MITEHRFEHIWDYVKRGALPTLDHETLLRITFELFYEVERLRSLIPPDTDTAESAAQAREAEPLDEPTDEPADEPTDSPPLIIPVAELVNRINGMIENADRAEVEKAPVHPVATLIELGGWAIGYAEGRQTRS